MSTDGAESWAKVNARVIAFGEERHGVLSVCSWQCLSSSFAFVCAIALPLSSWCAQKLRSQFTFRAPAGSTALTVRSAHSTGRGTELLSYRTRARCIPIKLQLAKVIRTLVCPEVILGETLMLT